MNAAINILLFSATTDFIPKIKIIKRYNIIPIITECNNIINPFSIFDRYTYCVEIIVYYFLKYNFEIPIILFVLDPFPSSWNNLVV